MISIYKAPDIAWDGAQNAAVMELFADTASEITVSSIDGIKILQGSTCTACDTGDKYRIDSTGTWHLMPSQQSQIILPDVYSETEVDNLLSDLDTSLTAQMYVHDSTQVNLNDVTWTRSGGGLYYSSTVTIPDSPVRLLYHATLSGFSNIRATDIITPACRRSGGWTGFIMYANTNSFLSGAWVTVSVSGLP